MTNTPYAAGPDTPHTGQLVAGAVTPSSAAPATPLREWVIPIAGAPDASARIAMHPDGFDIDVPQCRVTSDEAFSIASTILIARAIFHITPRGRHALHGLAAQPTDPDPSAGPRHHGTAP